MDKIRERAHQKSLINKGILIKEVVSSSLKVSGFYSHVEQISFKAQMNTNL